VIVITGGGTGGHLAIANALKNELNKRGIKPIYMGSLKGQDRDWFENDNGFSQKYFFDTRGVVNQNFFGKVGSMLKIASATKDAMNIYKKNSVKKVISVGGFSAAPASFAAVATKKDFYIHEQNSVTGKLNSTLQKYAKEFFSSYSETSSVKDYPVDSKFFENQKEIDSIKKVIFLGGSQGARNINNYALKVAPYLEAKNIQIIHQTGKDDYLEVAREYKRLGILADVFNFSKEIDKKIQEADFAVSRSGASTLWELTASGVPTLFVPYPYAAGDHQYHNAKFLLDKELCYLKREEEIQEEDFYEIIEKNSLSDMSQKLKEIISPDGAKNLIDKVLED
jgi:UDP-N-acetylglucosamine--N-acetylmuramyl-(pentapeptide) pyrophosphoryl-undecaprenol N-acetylglucosamine transferase